MVFERKAVKNGSLARLAPQFEVIDTAAELANSAYVEAAVRNKWFYTANYAMYSVEHGQLWLTFGGREANPIFSNLAHVCQQFMDHQRYSPSTDERLAIAEAVASNRALKVRLADLMLEPQNNTLSFFEIETANHEHLIESQRAFAEKIFGAGHDFRYNLEALFQAGIYQSKISVLNPESLTTSLDEGEAELRPCLFHIFDNYTKFSAADSNVANISAMHGIPVIAEREEDYEY